MKFTWGWLSDWVDLPATPEDLAHALAMRGFPVASIERGVSLDPAIVVGRVLEVAPHPNADRLRLCSVDIGSAKLSIVCGASNVAAGQSVAVAQIGAKLPDGTKLRKTKIRGVESEGMICSERELGLSEESEGIWAIPGSPAIGSPVQALLGAGDTILDVEITSNRTDCTAARGLPREIAARAPRHDRESGRLPALHGPRRGRDPDRALAGLAPAAAGSHRIPLHQQRRGRHELRAPNARPADPRLRRLESRRLRDPRAPCARRGEAHAARRARRAPSSRGARDRGPLEADGARRDHGRSGDRRDRVHHERDPGIRAVLARADARGGPEPGARHRRVAALHPGRRPAWSRDRAGRNRSPSGRDRVGETLRSGGRPLAGKAPAPRGASPPEAPRAASRLRRGSGPDRGRAEDAGNPSRGGLEGTG